MSNFVDLLKTMLDKIHKYSLMLSEHWNGSKEYRLFSGMNIYVRWPKDIKSLERLDL